MNMSRYEFSKYAVRPLLPQHATSAAKLEARYHPVGARTGRGEIIERLECGEAEGVNLSIGLFHGSRLVGYVLAFRDQGYCRAPSFLKNTTPVENNASDEPAICLVDIVMAYRHRGAAVRLLRQFTACLRMRRDLHQLPVIAYCNDEWWRNCSKHGSLFARFGFELHAVKPLLCTQGAVWHCLRFVRIARPSGKSQQLHRALRKVDSSRSAQDGFTIGVLGTFDSWSLLEPYWNILHDQTTAAEGFQTYEYLRTWWSHIGWPARIYIVVVLRDGVPVAIAPMQITVVRQLRCLNFLGLNTEMDRPTVLVNASVETQAISLIAGYLVQRRQDWDHLALYAQRPDSAFLQTLAARLNMAGYLTSVMPGTECACVDIQGTWTRYLGKKSRGVRKGIRRKQEELRKAGQIRFDVGLPDSSASLFERYLRVETQSWKPGAGLGVAKSSGHLTFYRSLAEEFGAAGRLKFAFLYCDDTPVAATFGIGWHDRFYSLHIAHDERYASYSPGAVLTALELEHNFNDGSYAVFDFLGGFLTNKTSWSTRIDTTTALFVNRPNLIGRAFHWYLVVAKPAVKRCLIRHDWHDKVLQWRKLICSA